MPKPSGIGVLVASLGNDPSHRPYESQARTCGDAMNSFGHYRRPTTTSNLAGRNILHSLSTMALLPLVSQRSYPRSGRPSQVKTKFGGHDRNRTYSPLQERIYSPPRLSYFAACPLVFLQGNDPWSLAYQASALPLSYRNKNQIVSNI